jgi:hypothetical protein
MDRWFSLPAAVAPGYAAPDTTTIRMDRWVLTFPRARQVYVQLLRERIWANTAAQAEIATMLRRRHMLGRSRRSFGNLMAPANLQDRDYINQRVVSFQLSDLDDMSAALGRFVFRVLVAGTVEDDGSGRGFPVTIERVGVYLRDSYDFNGDQFLGFWDDSDNSVSMTNPFSGTGVSNSDFRDWRARNRLGGDFLVYSDVKRVTLRTPDTFYVR